MHGPRTPPLRRYSGGTARAVWMCAFTLAAGCHDRRRGAVDSPTDATRLPADVAVVAPEDAGVPDADTPANDTPVDDTPWLQVTTVQGPVSVDSTLRLRTAPTHPGGPALRPGGGAPGRGPATVAQGLFPGDGLSTGTAGGATVSSGHGATVTLAGESTVVVPGYAGALAVLTRGMADLRATEVPVRLDTPAGRVIVSGGEATVGVAGDGAVVVRSTTGVVTVWPSPPPPAPRSTRISAAEIARRRQASAGHPVLLDIDLPDLAAQWVRPVAARTLAPGEALAWDPVGEPHRHSPPARASRAVVVRWLATQDQAVASPGAHLIAIALLGRAGGGDLADARAATARLRAADTGGDAGGVHAREELVNALSLALGRATARALRGRDLAARGGDVTALVQLAPTEDLCEAARAVMPLTR